jgi:hypothetical protein
MPKMSSMPPIAARFCSMPTDVGVRRLPLNADDVRSFPLNTAHCRSVRACVSARK